MSELWSANPTSAAVPRVPQAPTSNPATSSSSVQRTQADGGSNHGRTALYGFRGKVHFDKGNLASFANALDRLLNLHGNSHVHVKLVLYSIRGDNTPDPEKAGHPCALQLVTRVGSLGGDDSLLYWLRRYLSDPKFDRTYAPFICEEGEKLPPVWAPKDLQAEGVLRLQMARSTFPDDRARVDCAYLRMPTNNPEVWYENLYGPQIESVARLLWPVDKSPAEADRHVVAEGVVGLRHSDGLVASYGALSFPSAAFKSLVSGWKKDSTMAGTLSGVDFVPLKGDKLFIHVPGFYPRDATEFRVQKGGCRFIQAATNIMKTLQGALHPAVFKEMQAVEVWIPGIDMYLDGSGVLKRKIAMGPDGLLKATDLDSVESTAQAIRNFAATEKARGAKFLKFISLSPMFGDSKTGSHIFLDAMSGKAHFKLGGEANLASFTALVNASREQVPSARQMVPGQTYIRISHAYCGWKTLVAGEDEGEAAPESISRAMNDGRKVQSDPGTLSFLITPNTTEAEFWIICRKFLSPYLTYDIVTASEEPGK